LWSPQGTKTTRSRASQNPQMHICVDGTNGLLNTSIRSNTAIRMSLHHAGRLPAPSTCVCIVHRIEAKLLGIQGNSSRVVSSEIERFRTVSGTLAPRHATLLGAKNFYRIVSSPDDTPRRAPARLTIECVSSLSQVAMWNICCTYHLQCPCDILPP